MKKILVVDDSQYMRAVIKDMLGSNYEIVEAENGKVGLEKIGIEKPDLILLDIIMPEMDGIELLKEIGLTQKVVIISAVGQEKMVEEAKKLGAKHYLTKPFENEKVLNVVEEALK